jgi:hypothetical protein
VGAATLSNVGITVKSPLAKLISRQYGVVSRQQALDLGMSLGALRHSIRQGGPWQCMFPGVYVVTTVEPTTDQRDMAALLYAGSGSVISGLAALRRHQVRAPQSGIVDVLVSHEVKRAGGQYVRMQRTRNMPGTVAGQRGISFTMVPRAVTDAARWMTDLREVRALVAGVVQQRRCSVELLAAELAEPRLPGSALVRQVLAEVDLGIRSVAEGDLMDLIRRSTLPQPLYNPSLYVGRELLAVPDAWWPAASVAAEADSVEWHLSPDDWRRTTQRHDRMTAAGIAVLHFQPSQIRQEPAEVVKRIAGAIQNGRPAAGIRTVPAAA